MNLSSRSSWRFAAAFSAAALLNADCSIAGNASEGNGSARPAAGSPPAADETAPQPPPLSEEARQIADELQRTLPAGSEARAMFDDIVSGSRLSPTDGWFALATAQKRFDWEKVRSLFDSNDDGAIDRKEIAGVSDADFPRLDRNGDGQITESDLDLAAPAQDRDAAYALYRGSDADSDGRITAREFAALFETLDRDGAGFVTIDDLRSHFARTESSTRRRGGGPSREVLLRGLIRQEIGSLQAGPALGESVPDFTLKTQDGTKSVTLSQQIGEKPVVLVFGNFTCGPFRSQSGNVEKLFRRYGDRATFLMIYVREAHPTDGWHMPGKSGSDLDIAQPRSYEERVAVAQTCQGRLNLGMPFLVDEIDDRVGATYSGMPSRLYLIDQAGTVAYKSGRGPHGFKPSELEQSLLLLLASETPGR